MFRQQVDDFYVSIFGSRARMMKAFYDTHNASTDCDDKTHIDYFTRLAKETQFAFVPRVTMTLVSHRKDQRA